MFLEDELKGALPASQSDKVEQLADRFRRWILTAPSAEELDRTVKSVHGVELADYLLPHQNVIIEQKEITVDVAKRIQVLNQEMLRLGEVYGFDPTNSSTHEINRLITGNRDRFSNNKVYLNQLRFLKEDVSKANRQIRATKERLKMPTARGLVVLINQCSGELAISVIVFAIDRLLHKKRTKEERLFSHINGVLLFQNRPIVGPRANVIAFVSAHTVPSIDRFAYELMSAWTGGNPIEYGHVDSTKNAKLFLL